MSGLESLTETREIALSIIAMAALVVGGAMLYHSVMETVGVVVLALSFVCMVVVVSIA